MDRFARTVLGHHGCSREVADRLLTGDLAISDWQPSESRCDWIGKGIYFWEHSPERAVQWARAKQVSEGAQGRKFEPAVVGAVIQLGTCFDLTDVAYAARLREGYELVRRVYRAEGWKLPVNRGRDPDLEASISSVSSPS